MPLYIWVLLHLAPATWSVYHALLHKSDTRSAMGWIMASIFIPYAGPVAYFLFGINRVKTRARGLKRPLLAIDYETDAGKSQLTRIEGDRLQEIGERITGRQASAANEVTPLYNGEAAYPAMLASIAQARHRVLLTSYILKADDTGLAFVTALQAAAARGAEVKVLIDGIGELYSSDKPLALLQRDTQHNIQVARFLPPRLLPPSIYVNLRNHRKLLLVDDQIGYAGGMNISDDHSSAAGRPRAVTDVHFRLRGPVLAELTQLFNHDWHFTTGSSIGSSKSSQKNQPATNDPAIDQDMHCRVIPEGPDDELDTLSLTIETVISAASDSVDIMTPYFLPSAELTASLQSAVLRGVKVRIVLPAKNNLFYMHWAPRDKLAELLKWDIEIFYQPAPFCHSKLLCIDHNYSLIGSANLDPRSLRLNFELGIEVFSEKLNRELKSHIERTIALSRPVSYTELFSRPVLVRLRDSAAALFSPYL